MLHPLPYPEAEAVGGARWRGKPWRWHRLSPLWRHYRSPLPAGSGAGAHVLGCRTPRLHELGPPRILAARGRTQRRNLKP